MPHRKIWPSLMIGAWLWALVALACSGVSVSLDRAALQITIPTPVPTRVRLPPDATFLDVQADSGWQDTGLQFRAGHQFQVAYVSGQVVDRDSLIADGDGWDYVCGRASCCEPLPTARRSALIGKLGGHTFFIGNGGLFSAPADGHLLLRINDCDEGLYDNSGSLKVGLHP
jgi:hypothetical protein